MAANTKYKHFTLEDREVIAKGIENGSTKASLGRVLGKDSSAIAKEIRKHRERYRKGRYPTQCRLFSRCPRKKTCQDLACSDYAPFYCPRRDRTPGACNGCSKISSCPYERFLYHPAHAHDAYRKELVAAREGLDLTREEVERMARIVVPLIQKKHSPYMIVKNHPELGLCEKTLYNYITMGVFAPWHVIDLDLRLKVKRKMPKKRRALYKKREDKRYLKGRTYEDYLAFLQLHEGMSIVQMDTVYNDVAGPYLQTFKFVDLDFLVAFFHLEKTASAMLAGVNALEALIGPELFLKYVQVLLTDRGTEFTFADLMETAADGTKRTCVFYCDPMAAGQKGSLEKQHSELRYIVPKGVSFANLGLTGQDKLNLALSHVNSFPKKKNHGKRPFDLLQFFAPDLLDKFTAFGIQAIEMDQVFLSPLLLK